jgi:hypothetical protein
MQAGYDLPALGAKISRSAAQRPTPIHAGVAHAVLAALIAVTVTGVLSAGLEARAFRHNQTCFIVAAGMAVAGYITHRVMPIQSPLWSALAVPMAAMLAYLLAAIRAGGQTVPATIPASNYLHILPIQFVGIGTVAAVAMYWSVGRGATTATGNAPTTPTVNPAVR